MLNIVRILCFGLFGIITASGGINFIRWQFWALLMLLMAVQIISELIGEKSERGE